jgi:hypothetical protein
VVEQHHIGARRSCQGGEFTDFAGADQRGGLWPIARLESPVYDNRACACGQFAKLFERFFRLVMKIGRR